MTDQIKVVHYLNQFFAGIGGEEKANVPVTVREGPVGPGRALQGLLGSDGSIVGTIVCGDNYFGENPGDARAAVTETLREMAPDVLIAGPAFDAGRYGLACREACRAARKIDVPALTAMHPENAGPASARRDLLIMPTGSTPAEMQQVLSDMLPLAMKLARGGELGPASEEGYLPTGDRRTITRDEPGYKRAVDMLVSKLQGRPFESEVP